MSDRVLTNLSAARHALSECKTVMQAKQIADAAEAARVYLERTKASVDTVNEATEIRLLAEKQMGEYLRDAPKNEGAKGVGKSALVKVEGTPTLKEMGITYDQSSRAQRLAVMPEEEFQRRIEAGKANGKLTIAAVVNPPAQEVVYDASTDEEDVEVIAPRHPKPLMQPSAAAVAAGEQAEKDGERLWQLKTWWKRANKKERAAFLQWIKTQQ